MSDSPFTRNRLDTADLPEAAVGVDDAIRALIREELRIKQPGPPPRPPKGEVFREAAMLFFALVNIGLVLALFSDIDEKLKPILGAAATLGSGALAGGYGWWRAELIRIVRHPALLGANVVVFMGLAALHVARNVPVVPVYVNPSSASVAIDNGSPEPDYPARLTLRSHKVEVTA